MPGRPFSKGHDARRGPGNHAPKVASEARDAYRELSPKARAVLEAALSSDDERIRVDAARLIEDRAWGRPTQMLGEDPEAQFGAQRQAVEDVRAQLLEEMAGGALPPASPVPALEAAQGAAVTSIVSADGDLDADDLDDDE